VVTDYPLISDFRSLITKWDLFRVFLRAFFIQSVWNFERMQNVGFLYALIPALKKLYPDRKECQKSFLRHLEFFNTQPYMASFIIGLTIAKEEENVREKGVLIQQISTLKKSMFGPLAVLGDSFFWAGIRPFFSLLGSILALSMDIWGPIIFLLLYNLVHLSTRFLAILMGYRFKEGVVGEIKKLPLQRLTRDINVAGMVISGLGLGILFKLWPLEFFPHFWTYLAQVFGCTIIVGLFSLIIRRGISAPLLFLILVSLSLIIAPFFGS